MGMSLLLSVLVAWPGNAGTARPWQKRVSQSVESRHTTAHRNTPIKLWPTEPEAPASIAAARFESALSSLCGPMPKDRLSSFTRTILEAAATYKIDPFLLGALVYDQSRCWPKTYKRDEARGLFGLTRLPVDMHAPHARRGTYRYYILNNGKWEARELAMPPAPFNRYRAADPIDGLYLAAAILRVLELQHADLDESLPQTPHRHFISHWFYGDIVKETEPETRVLTVRRRLLVAYRGESSAPVGELAGVPLLLPLDGAPRLVLDYFGNPRDKKKDGYYHRGIDLDAAEGEPVRAIAAGKVSFAGTDLPGSQESGHLTPQQAVALLESGSKLGPGGLYVHINHGNQVGSIYMHLSTISVSSGDTVEAGQIIGTAGRTGTDVSGPHLHLELRIDTERVDPAAILAPALVNPFRAPTAKP